jgi:hypothetical protein
MYLAMILFYACLVIGLGRRIDFVVCRCALVLNYYLGLILFLPMYSLPAW